MRFASVLAVMIMLVSVPARSADFYLDYPADGDFSSILNRVPQALPGMPAPPPDTYYVSAPPIDLSGSSNVFDPDQPITSTTYPGDAGDVFLLLFPGPSSGQFTFSLDIMPHDDHLGLVALYGNISITVVTPVSAGLRYTQPVMGIWPSGIETFSYSSKPIGGLPVESMIIMTFVGTGLCGNGAIFTIPPCMTAMIVK